MNIDTQFAALIFKKDASVAVTIKSIDLSGVAVVTNTGVHGVIKAKSFGKKVEERLAMMRNYQVGQTVMATVCEYNMQTRSLLLSLASSANSPVYPHTLGTSSKVTRKPMKQQIPTGWTIWVDASNVLYRVLKTFPEYTALDVLRTLEEGAIQMGYDLHFVMEYRAMGWHYWHTPENKQEAWRQFCDKHVIKVMGEADEMVLRLASQTPASVILSNDRFRDYAELYPELVGSSRIHTFDLMGTDAPAVVISGVHTLFTLKHFEETAKPKAVKAEAVCAPELECIEPRVEVPVTPRASEVVEGVSALRMKVAEHDPEALFTLATYYAEGNQVYCDFEKSVRLDRAAVEAQKRVWQTERRHRRRIRATQVNWCRGA